MMHKTCSINYGHLADLQKTIPIIDLNKKKQVSFDKISPRDFYFCPFFSICTSGYITHGHNSRQVTGARCTEGRGFLSLTCSVLMKRKAMTQAR